MIKAKCIGVSQFWRDIVTDIAQSEYPEIELTHMYVDNASMQLIRNPKQFDVILTSNIFGDILSDEASMLSGSIGLLPSASIGKGVGLYEPIHGSAPDIAGQGIANPLATISSLSMLLKYALGEDEASLKIANAIKKALEQGVIETGRFGGALWGQKEGLAPFYLRWGHVIWLGLGRQEGLKGQDWEPGLVHRKVFKFRTWPQELRRGGS